MTVSKIFMETTSEAVRERTGISIRMNAAFHELRIQGIKVIRGYWCCEECASSAIKDEKPGRKEFAYCYTTEQDEDERKNGFNFYLKFGHFGNPREGQSRFLGLTICDTLKEYGIRTIWNKDVSKPIMVYNKNI